MALISLKFSFFVVICEAVHVWLIYGAVVNIETE
jgi:uncharacterized protein with PQ loop repeat